MGKVIDKVRTGAMRSRSGRIVIPRWAKVALIVGAIALLPIAAEAHSLTGASGWTDELVCLVPAAIMIVLVLVLGRDGKPGAKKKDDP
jgi:peptidoglycan/LPS O-acetylase OafA/YrhL